MPAQDDTKDEIRSRLEYENMTPASADCETAHRYRACGLTIEVLIDDPSWDAPVTEPAGKSLIGIEDGWFNFLSQVATRAYSNLRNQDLAPVSANVAVSLSNDAAIAGLNQTYRQKALPTNVLAFPSGESWPNDAASTGDEVALGDIMIAYETVCREAADQEKPLAAHVGHLLVHALLHLLGFDHQTDEEAEEMEALEIELLAEMGISDPYAEIALPPRDPIPPTEETIPA